MRNDLPGPGHPWQVLAFSASKESPTSFRRAVQFAVSLRSAGFLNARVHDGEEMEGFKCCFWSVIAGSFATEQAAVELRGLLRQWGVPGAYVKRATPREPNGVVHPR